MAENEIDEECICVVYDGTGYGEDGNLWGGEILACKPERYHRLGHLSYMPEPGGEASIYYPGRMALGALYEKMGEEAGKICDWMPEHEKQSVLELLKTKTNCPLTSGMGRLFDALSAILHICCKRSYEGQPAMELEGIAEKTENGFYPVFIFEKDNQVLFDGSALLLEAWGDFQKGTSASIVSARFHNSIAKATALMVKRASITVSLKKVCLTGGCFQNVILLSKTIKELESAGFEPVVHRLVPANDGGIAYGQLVIAGAKRQAGMI
jgi:hydrogenase maturation protein HypF